MLLYRAAPYMARLDNVTCWCAHMDTGVIEFLDVDLGEEKFIKSIAFQGGVGEHKDKAVTQFDLAYSSDDHTVPVPSFFWCRDSLANSLLFCVAPGQSSVATEVCFLSSSSNLQCICWGK